jgi:nucleotide-binding universal stress UspA family protein
MNDSFQFNTLLVPVDFSPASQAAFDRALRVASGDSAVVILLHVIDPSLAEFAAAHGFGSHEEIVERMRKRAGHELQIMKDRAGSIVEIDPIVSEGPPFLEILRKAEDFVVDAIVLGKVGTRGAIEKLLFGTTAEKVLRGSQRPVLILPYDE